MTRWFSFLALLLVVSLSAPGCRDDSTSTAKSTLTAEDVWHKMLKAYREAPRYRDRAVVRLTYQQDGETVRDEADVSIRFQSPNKLRLQAYKTLVTCDGHEFRAKILDEATKNIDGQIVVRPAPESLTAAEIYGDELLRAQMENAVLTPLSPRMPAQVELLCAAKPFETTLAAGKFSLAAELVKVGDAACHQLTITTGNGDYRLAIDAESFLLRRLEYPREALIEEMANSPQIRDARLIAEFHGATISETIDESLFTQDLPADAKKVRFFVPPPQPLPSNLFGQVPKPFSFAELKDGAAVGQVGSDELLGKIAALLWFNNYASCELALKQFEIARKTLADASDVRLLAICTESEAVSHQQICDLVARWNVTPRLCRDTAAHGRDVFAIEAVPSLVVLDARGVVQVVQLGASANLATELPTIVEKIRNGEDVAKLVRERHQQDLAQYARQLSVAMHGGKSHMLEIPLTKIKEKSAPKKLRLEPLWESTAVKSPGNLYAHSTFSGEPRLFVVENSRAVVELSSAGEVAARHEIDMPPQGTITALRGAINRAGHDRFVAFAPLGHQLFVFDEQWNQTANYPAADQPHDGLRDVRLVDLDDNGNAKSPSGDGEPELYVAFWGVIGVQRVTLNGKREWAQRGASNLLSVAVTPRDDFGWRRLIVANESGRLLPVNRFGNAESTITVPNWLVHQLHVNRITPSPANYCGVAYAKDGNLVAVALDDQLEEQWNYPFPPGLHSSPVEFITSAQLRDEKDSEWLFAGADGSLHIVSADGEFADFFHIGEAITGLSATRWNNQPVLLVATPSRVMAWRVAK